MGGYFTYINGLEMTGIARWNGQAWTKLGNGPPSAGVPARALAVYDDGTGPALYAGGPFRQPEGPGNRIAKWNGTAWSPLGTGMNAMVRALAVYDDGSGPALYAGGDFSMAGGLPANRV